jgi:ABC-type spermidine/putrescine transport system permease subunit I
MGPSGAKYSATLIYQQFVSTFNWPRGSAIAAILLMITAAALALILGGATRRYRHLLRSH